MPSYTFKIGGEAGYGIMTAGLLFSKTCTRSGFNIFDYVEYPSLIRGGHNVMETHFGVAEIFSQERGVDLLVALNHETIERHLSELKDGGAVLFDPKKTDVSDVSFPKNIAQFPVPLEELAEQMGLLKVMRNNVALGASVALFGLDIEILLGVITDVFADKGEKIIKDNQMAARAGFDYVGRQNYEQRSLNRKRPSPEFAKDNKKLVLTGNEAIGLGAIAAGCKFYAAYPMTPSSSILHYLASKAPETGMIVRHAEDEIGVVNEALGASFAGARSMVGTSGGGFALMNEAVSLAGVSETPLVIVVAQRPGPATGLPTWTEQGDLQFIIRSGHGEFPKIVLAPGDVEEALELTFKAHNLADIYQEPVFIVSDKFLSESHKSINSSNLESRISNLTVDRGKLEDVKGSEKVGPYPRYKTTADGISPRILPGTPGFYYQANSYEHLEDGHTTENAEERARQVDKRARKAATYVDLHFRPPTLYGPKDAELTFVGWGSTKGPMLQAIQQSTLNHSLRSDSGQAISNQQFNFLHFNHIWPLDGELVKSELKKHTHLVIIENNSTGQLGQLLRQETGINIKEKLLKYNGRPFYPEEILDYVKNFQAEEKLQGNVPGIPDCCV